MWAPTAYQTKPNHRSQQDAQYPIQPKLKVGKPGDKYEQQADRVADTVMRMPDPQLLRQPIEEEEDEMMQMQTTEEEEELQMQPMEEEEEELQMQAMEEEEELQMKSNSEAGGQGTSEVSGEISQKINSSKGSGTLLEPNIQQEMSAKMGSDFRDINIHTDSHAEDMNQELGARAFTHGRDIYFNKGEFKPASSSGKHLLAHELTHVVQQTTPDGPNMISRDPDDSSALPSDKREELIRLTGNRITRSAAYYNDALLEVKIKVGNMLKKQKEAADAIFELAFGLLMPGVGKLLGRGLASVAATLPASASTASYKAAMALLDENRTKELFVKAADIGLKVSKIDLNNKLESITGNAEYEAFFTALEKSAATGFDEIDANLSSKTDKELGVLYMSYDPGMLSSSDYVRVIERLFLKFKEQVNPIGKRTDGRYGSMKARWIEGSKWKALALTGEGRYFNVGAGPTFITWISPDMKKPAIEATKAINWGRVDTVHYGNVQGGSSASMRFLLDSDFPYGGDDKVLEPSSGTTRRPSRDVCPSCHGETGGTGSPNTGFSGFEFEEWQPVLTPPESESISESDIQAIREWINSVPNE